MSCGAQTQRLCSEICNLCLTFRLQTQRLCSEICNLCLTFRLRAPQAIKKTFPEHYLYDPTPIPEVVWRVSTECVAVEERGNKWVFVQGKGVPQLPAGA
jgi:hypothetical protein